MPQISVSSEAYERIEKFGVRTGVGLEHAATAAILLWIQTEGEEIVAASRSSRQRSLVDEQRLTTLVNDSLGREI